MNFINSKASPPVWVIFLLIFIEGFVSISIEVLAMRQVQAFAGANIVTSSMVIGVFLLFLAYGYGSGGKIKSKWCEILIRNFILTAVISGIGLSYIFVQVFFFYFNPILSHYLLTLLIWLLIVCAPSAYLLGQTVPICMQWIEKLKHMGVGRVGGNSLQLSTIGSCLGAVGSSLVLMYFFGVAWSILINVLLLLIMSTYLLYISPIRFDNFIGVFISLLFIGTAVYTVNIKGQYNYFLKDNSYANYIIHDDFMINGNVSGSLFSVNGGNSSFLSYDDFSGFDYMETVKKILFDSYQYDTANILILGAAGFSLSATPDLNKDNKFLYVDIDPDIYELSEQFNPNITGEFIAQDARLFLYQNKLKFDAIIFDAYSSLAHIPESLVTVEAFYNIRKALNQQGVFIANLIMDPLLRDNYSRTLDASLRSIFTSCGVLNNWQGRIRENVLYICHNENVSRLYTDDLNRVSIDVGF